MSISIRVQGNYPEFVEAYGPKRVVNLERGSGSGAKQSFKTECDINSIMAKYQRTGTLAWLNESSARFGDATGVDFAEAMTLVAQANEAFDALPSTMRRRFANDPARFMEFVDDPANDLEAIKLGIKVAKPPVPVPADFKPPMPPQGVPIAS